MKISASTINYIETLIRNQPGLSSHKIARFAGVSQCFVANHRKKMLTTIETTDIEKSPYSDGVTKNDQMYKR